MPKPLVFALALTLALGGLFFWIHEPKDPGITRVLLLDPPAVSGLSADQAQSVGTLLMDALETRGDLAVTSLAALPEPFHPEGTLLVIRPLAARDGQVLRLRMEWAEMGEGRPGTWHVFTTLSGNPASALDEALEGLPLRWKSKTHLFPQNPGSFWDLVTAESASSTNENLDGALAIAYRLVQQEPKAARVWATLARLETLNILQNPKPLGGQLDQALGAAKQALQVQEGYPAALRILGRLLSDQGHQDQSLELLRVGLKLHPHSLNLLLAVDYAARTAGLLDLALGARSRISALWSGYPIQPPIGFTYLYAERLKDFEASFQPNPGASRRDGFDTFHLGYAALLRKKFPEALEDFRFVEQNLATESHYRALAKVFRLQLEGKNPEAIEALEALDRSRLGLQVPDGEFTFNMAEAACYLGKNEMAMNLAQRAFSQGFFCGPWYRHNPLLAPIQSLPRWRSILQHVDGRQARLAAQFNLEDFGW